MHRYLIRFRSACRDETISAAILAWGMVIVLAEQPGEIGLVSTAETFRHGLKRSVGLAKLLGRNSHLRGDEKLFE